MRSPGRIKSGSFEPFGTACQLDLILEAPTSSVSSTLPGLPEPVAGGNASGSNSSFASRIAWRKVSSRSAFFPELGRPNSFSFSRSCLSVGAFRLEIFEALLRAQHATQERRAVAPKPRKEPTKHKVGYSWYHVPASSRLGGRFGSLCTLGLLPRSLERKPKPPEARNKGLLEAMAAMALPSKLCSILRSDRSATPRSGVWGRLGQAGALYPNVAYALLFSVSISGYVRQWAGADLQAFDGVS